MAETTFPEFITARRRELELTLGDVASDVGVSPITVSNWSNGQSIPKKENLIALAAVLDLPPDELADIAGVELDVELEPEAEIIMETVEATDEVEDSDDVVPADLPDVAAVEIPTIEQPLVAETETAQTDVEEDVIEDSLPEAPEMQAESEVREDATGEAATEEAEEMTPVPQSVPDVIPRVTVTPPTPAQVSPLTYVQDSKQLLRYRIRWGITTVALIVMAFVLFWALAGLFDALSEVKQSVTTP